VQQLVLDWMATYGASALFGLLMLGIIGLPVPDETLLTFAGVLISRGKLSLIPTWLAGVLGGMSGITCSYLIGRTTGIVFVRRYGKWFHLKPAQIERAGLWLSHRGKWALTYGYFIPGVRHVTGIVAGSSGLAYRIFATFAYLGAFLWATGFVFLGWYASEKWERILAETHRSALIVCAVAAVTGGMYLLLRRNGHVK
jgi:membrane protein DedA with SNARE-associated domain